jgi:hypothetical protein
MLIRNGVRVGLAIVTGWCGAAHANNIHVCSTCAHTTIQGAVNDAASGDTVYIAAGRYVENVTIAGKALTIIGDTSGVASVVGAGRGPVFTLGDAGAASPANLIDISNLTISGGNHLDGTGEGGGIQVRNGAYLQLSNSTVAHNIAISGAGISFRNPTRPDNTITHCVIENNTATVISGTSGGLGGGLAVFAVHVSIFDSIIAQNRAVDGGGVYQTPGPMGMEIDDSTISRNTTYILPSPSGAVGGRGAGIFANAGFFISHTVITDNVVHSLGGGGGMYVNASSLLPLTITDTIISHNVADFGGGAGMQVFGTVDETLTLTNDYIIENTGLGFFTETSLKSTNTTVKDNSVEDCASGSVSCPH